MPASSRDAAALWDMVQAIQEIQEDVAGLSYEDFLDNRTVRRAVERNFEILGEAARRVSASFQREQVEVDWSNIIGLRNVLAHQYEMIRYEILWDVIVDNLPTLKPKLEALLPPLEEG
jgi:uncharacterized protein with HEPN domain